MGLVPAACRLVAAGLCFALAGCASPPEGFDSPEPAARLRAISAAASERDRSKVPDLIESLRSDDPVVRMAAIRTLEDLTGQTLGYDYAAPPWDRELAIQAWLDWYRSQPAEPRGAVQNGIGGFPGPGGGVRTSKHQAAAADITGATRRVPFST